MKNHFALSQWSYECLGDLDNPELNINTLVDQILNVLNAG